MEKFEIILPRYQDRIPISKDELLSKFPNSFLIIVLEQDPTAKEIEITRSFITPTIMDNDFQQASRYLVIDILISLEHLNMLNFNIDYMFTFRRTISRYSQSCDDIRCNLKCFILLI